MRWSFQKSLLCSKWLRNNSDDLEFPYILPVLQSRRANSNKSQNPIPEGYLANDFFDAAQKLGDANRFQNFIPAYAKYLYSVQQSLEKIESGETTVDTSNMSPERAAAIEGALDSIKQAVPGFREAWTNIIDDMEGMNSMMQLPRSMAKHMGPVFKSIMLNGFAVLLKNGATEIVADWGKNLMTLPPALFKDLAACPLRLMSLTMVSFANKICP